LFIYQFHVTDQSLSMSLINRQTTLLL